MLTPFVYFPDYTNRAQHEICVKSRQTDSWCGRKRYLTKNRTFSSFWPLYRSFLSLSVALWIGSKPAPKSFETNLKLKQENHHLNFFVFSSTSGVSLVAFNANLTLSVISVIRIINNWYQIGNLIDCTVSKVYSTRVNSNFSPKQNLIQNMHFILRIVDLTHKWKKANVTPH